MPAPVVMITVLAVIAVWVTKNGRNPIMVILPLVFLLVMTTWALVIQAWEFAGSDELIDVFLLAPLDVLILVLALWLIVEAFLALRASLRARRGVGASTQGSVPAED